jgi:hypothetical protein
MVAGDEESNGDGNEGGRRATATRVKVTAMRAMVTVTGGACDKEARARVMPKAMRVVRDADDMYDIIYIMTLLTSMPPPQLHSARSRRSRY